jgi:DNA polymerase-4
MTPIIFHVDLDCFFVAVERLYDPTLLGIPVAVGGRGPRAVLSAASYEARKFGVHSALPTRIALERCPHLKLVEHHFDRYVKYSREVFRILHEWSPTVEGASLDEAYLDMSGTERLYGAPDVAAAKLREQVLSETKLTLSIGIAANRRVAKIASDLCKPNGLLWIKPEEALERLAPLSVKKIPGVGPKTEAELHRLGMFRIRDLQERSENFLKNIFGESSGDFLFRASRGMGSTAFFEDSKKKTISRERTYSHDKHDRELLQEELKSMAHELGKELREEGNLARTAKLKLRYPPFETLTRSRKLLTPTHADAELERALLALFHEMDQDVRGVRLIGGGFECLRPEESQPQLDLFENDAKLEKLTELRNHLFRKGKAFASERDHRFSRPKQEQSSDLSEYEEFSQLEDRDDELEETFDPQGSDKV